jgi:carboxymethylenebutenolidase
MAVTFYPKSFFMDQRIINLYDEYTHKPLSRQEFIKRLTLITGSMAASLTVLAGLENKYEAAAITPLQDLFIEYITYPAVKGEMKAYVARPKQAGKYATVIVIHENRGLNAHIEDVARRAAQAGFLAIAPNALAPLGGTPANEDEARTLFTQLNADETRQNFINAISYASSRSDSNGNIGCVGFCWGGAMSNTLAVNVPSLKAAVVFYGRPPASAEVAKIKAAVQLHYAGLDERINAGMAEYEKALKEQQITYEQYLYEGVNHAFHNDTSGQRYNQAAATLAWQRTIEFFKKYLV